MAIKQKFRNRFLAFLKNHFNPLTRKVAQRSIGYFAIVRHVGRRSGKKYETPIMVQPTGDGFVIELTYGPSVDWYQNVLAAGGCTLFYHGREYVIDKIETLDTQSGRAAWPLAMRLIMRIAGLKHFVKLTAQG